MQTRKAKQAFSLIFPHDAAKENHEHSSTHNATKENHRHSARSPSQNAQSRRLKLCYKDEIRVITISKQDSLGNLKDVIRNTFDELQASDLTLRYEDMVNDSITIATDADLLLALEELFLRDDVPKFIIQAVDKTVNTAASSSFRSLVGSLKPTCKYFQAGNCRYGNKCKFLHEPRPSNEGGSSSSTPLLNMQMEKWLTNRMEQSASDTIEMLSSPKGLQMLENICSRNNLSVKVANLLVKLLTREELRNSMLKQDTNKIYGSLMGSAFLMQLQVHINNLNPVTPQWMESYVVLVEEIQYRTLDGWKHVPLDVIRGVLESLPSDPLREDLVKRTAILLEHRRTSKLQSATCSEANSCVMGSAFRSTQIIPSIEELLAPIGSSEVPTNKIGKRYTNLTEYLETHFRLLREDLIEPLRNGIREYRNKVSFLPDVRVYGNVQLREQELTVDGILTKISFVARTRKKMQAEDWKESKRLLFGALLCITPDNFNTISWATVIRRNSLAQGLVGVKLLEGYELDPAVRYVMVESTAAYFEAYSHVLRSLQREDMERLPFTEHLLSLERDVKEPGYLVKGDTYEFEGVFPGIKKELGSSSFRILREWPEWTTTLDESQRNALKHALTKRLALIQGPPGTGKTFLGLLIVRCLLANLKKDPQEGNEDEQNSTILIVCYTNHALDQFLEGIYTYEKQVIRVGGGSKSKALGECNLQKRMYDARNARALRGPHARARMRCKEEIEQLQKEIGRCVNLLKMEYVTKEVLHGVATEEQIMNLFYSSEQTVKSWLEGETLQGNANLIEEGNLGNMFDVLDDFEEENNADVEVVDDLETSDSDESGDSSSQEAEPGETGIHEYLPEEEIPLHMFIDHPNVWSLPVRERRRLHETWLGEIHGQARVKMSRLRQEHTVACEQNAQVNNEIQLSLLRGAKIVGMTTTAAARLHDMLAALQPKVVIVEEAAEVLESHILACLSPHTEHLILIGDHLQLRPSVATYKLAVKHRLDVSMFERLAQAGVEHAMLQTQRRMAPCISKLISRIYPALKNHPSVSEHEDVKGMKSNVFFMDHKSQEEAGHESGSKKNVTEAKMIVELCNYLLNQGCYTPRDITVLAMYKGQVQEIRKRLKDRFGGLNQDDEQEEVREILRVSSVDDYQGEENDIVVLSLVRSNLVPGKDGVGTIGFLKISNRVCVALSRARKGLYIFGNGELLSNKSSLWDSILGSMKEDMRIGSQLVLRCENHPSVETRISKPEDFKLVEDGGCSRPCEYQLDCGHVCPRRCHPGSHNAVGCIKMCYKLQEDCAHRCESICHANKACPPCSIKVIKTIPRCGHAQEMKCSDERTTVTCRSPCIKFLPCGHKCRLICGRPCPDTCFELVFKQLPCGHKARLSCSQDTSTFCCNEPCKRILEGCEHECQGTCGKCKQGTKHIECKRECGRSLPCGHPCKSKCSVPCPPCTRKCEKRCVHSKCSSICGKPCKPCIEPCAWRCPHFECNLLCYQVCRRERCDEPCSRALKCGHICIGLCGEPCPDKCRICNPHTFDVISQTRLDESDPDDRFIQLQDCNHLFEVSGLDHWMDMLDANASAEAIILKSCPECKTPIRRTYRYANVVKGKLEQIEQVKKRVYGYEHTNKGFEMLGKKEYAEALKLFVEAIRMQPGLFQAHLGMAATFCSTGKFREAVVHLRLILQHSPFASEIVDIIPDIPCGHVPLPTRNAGLFGNADVEVTVQAAVQLASALTGSNRYSEAVKVCEFALRHDEGNEEALEMKRQAEKKNHVLLIQDIKKALGSVGGSWYQCPMGHIYSVGECGQPMQMSRCPDCGSTIGGQQHRPVEGNQRVTSFHGL